MEHAVVYRNEDSFCGPISTLMHGADGELILIFREAKWRGHLTHRDPTTRTSLLRSRDGGRSWFSQVTPDPAGGNAAAGARLADGTWLLASFHWVFAPPEEADRLAHLPRYNQPDELNPNFSGRLGLACAAGGNFLTRSATEGYTWEPLWPLTEQAEWPGPVACPPILERPGGELLLCVTATRRDETQQHSVLLRSADRGRTWGEPLCLTAGAPAEVSFHESRLVACPGGRLLAMHRTKGNYWRNVSTDGGRSWSPPEETAVWCGGSSPPDLRLLADGRLLLTRGHRREPFGVQAHLSEDAGETWDVETPVVLRDDGFHFDMGYPTSVQLPDGEMLTVYYWQGRDGIRHLQSTRWELPG